MRDSMIFYRSFYEAIGEIPKENQLELYNAIFELAFNFKEVEISGITKAMFKLIKPQIEANNKRYINGSKGGKPKANQNVTEDKPKHNQVITKTEANKNVNDNENKNVNNKRFQKPSLEEIKSYMEEKQFRDFSEKFRDHYESNGWKVGKNPMKDWKAAVRQWNSRNQEYKSQTFKENQITII